MEAGRPRGLRVRTECGTEAAFIASFLRTCDDDSVFAPTSKMIPEGADCAFSLELADGEPMLRGLGVVIQSWPTADNPFGAAGVHIAIAQLTTGTQPIHERLLDARARAEGRPVGRTRPARITQLRIPMTAEELDRSDHELEDDAIVHEVRRTITQEMQAAPVEMIDERASHTIRYEGPMRAPANAAPRVPLPPPRRSIVAALPLSPHEPAALPEPPTYPGPPAFAEPATIPEASAFARGTPVPLEAAAPAGSSELAAAPRRPALALWRAVTARLRVVATRLEPTRRWLGARLARIRLRLAPARARLATWTAPARARLRPAWTRLRTWLDPRWARLVAEAKRMVAAARTERWRNARVAAVFVCGILVGVIASSWMRPSRAPQRVPIASIVPIAPAQCTPAAPAQPAVAAPAAVASAAPEATVPRHPAAAPKPARPATKAIAKTAVPAKPPAPPKLAAKPTPPPPRLAAKQPASPAKPAAPAPKLAAKPAPPPPKLAAKPRKTRCSTLDCL